MIAGVILSAVVVVVPGLDVVLLPVVVAVSVVVLLSVVVCLLLLLPPSVKERNRVNIGLSWKFARKNLEVRVASVHYSHTSCRTLATAEEAVHVSPLNARTHQRHSGLCR